MSHHMLFSVMFVGCLSIGMLLLLEMGRRLGTRGKHDEEETGAGFGAVEGAVFGLLGLLIESGMQSLPESHVFGKFELEGGS